MGYTCMWKASPDATTSCKKCLKLQQAHVKSISWCSRHTWEASHDASGAHEKHLVMHQAHMRSISWCIRHTWEASRDASGTREKHLVMHQAHMRSFSWCSRHIRKASHYARASPCLPGFFFLYPYSGAKSACSQEALFQTINRKTVAISVSVFQCRAFGRLSPPYAAPDPPPFGRQNSLPGWIKWMLSCIVGDRVKASIYCMGQLKSWTAII